MSTALLKFSAKWLRLAVVVACTTWVCTYPINGQSNQVNGLAAQSQAPAYLALGDSYPYGSDGTGFLPLNDNFWIGYPVYLAETIDRPLVNPACPGETAISFLTGDPADAGPNCQPAKDADLLHVNYTGSQMDFAEEYLSTHSRVVLVTLQIAGNDFQDFAGQCRGNLACIWAGLPAFEAEMADAIGTILSRIRGAGYLGQIIYVEYPTTNYSTPMVDVFEHFFQALLPVMTANDADVAPVFARFQALAEPYGGNSCTAGLLITRADGKCNIHPTQYGRQVIAAIIAEMVTGTAHTK